MLFLLSFICNLPVASSMSFMYKKAESKGVDVGVVDEFAACLT